MSLQLEVQYIEGCPEAREFMRRVRLAADAEDHVELVTTLVQGETHARRLQFRGSPTLLIDGRDMEGMPGVAAAGITCRLYPGGLPSVESIRLAIHAALR